VHLQPLPLRCARIRPCVAIPLAGSACPARPVPYPQGTPALPPVLPTFLVPQANQGAYPSRVADHSSAVWVSTRKRVVDSCFNSDRADIQRLRRPGADYQVRQSAWRSRDDAYWWRAKPSTANPPAVSVIERNSLRPFFVGRHEEARRLRRVRRKADILGRYKLPEPDAVIGTTRGWLPSTIDSGTVAVLEAAALGRVRQLRWVRL
jgi:hypothetical protein